MARVPASLRGRGPGDAQRPPPLSAYHGGRPIALSSFQDLRPRPHAALRHHLLGAPTPVTPVLGFGEVVGVDDIDPLLEGRSVIGHQVADEIGFEVCCRLSRPVGAMGHSWVQGAHPHSGTGEKCLLTVGKATGHRDLSALTLHSPRGGGEVSPHLHLVSRDPDETGI